MLTVLADAGMGVCVVMLGVIVWGVVGMVRDAIEDSREERKK